MLARLQDFLAPFCSSGGPCAQGSLSTVELAAFLLAALEYTRDQHPWLDRKGAAQAAVPLELAGPAELACFALAEVLDEEPALPSEACWHALQRFLGFEVVEAACGHRRATPRPYRWWMSEDELPGALRTARPEVWRVVAEGDWFRQPAGRDEVFRALLGPTCSLTDFVDLRRDAAATLARWFLAQSEPPLLDTSLPPMASALVSLFGDTTRAFAPAGLDPRAPFRSGQSWSQYDAEGNGSWGHQTALVLTDGQRLASWEKRWDVVSEGVAHGRKR